MEPGRKEPRNGGHGETDARRIAAVEELRRAILRAKQLLSWKDIQRVIESEGAPPSREEMQREREEP